MARGGNAIVVEGLDDLIRSFARLDKNLAKEIRKQERRVGTIVARRQREAALARGLRKTGKLARSNKPIVRGSTLYVVNRATNDGFPYPVMYEETGRSFFYQPAEDSMPEVVQGFDDMLGRMAGEEGF